MRQIHDKDMKQLYNQLKASAKSRNIVFTLNMMDLNDLTFPISCPILNIPLFFNKGRPQDNSVSIDRIDSSLGYEAGNIEVISYRANKLKSDATLDEIQKLAEHTESK